MSPDKKEKEVDLTLVEDSPSNDVPPQPIVARQPLEQTANSSESSVACVGASAMAEQLPEVSVLRLPQHRSGEPTPFDFMCRPAAAFGQLVGIALILIGTVFIIAHNSHWLTIPVLLGCFGFGYIHILLLAAIGAIKLQQPLLVEFFSGAIMPYGLFGRKWSAFSLMCMADALEARNKYSSAAICNGQAARTLGTLKVITQHKYILRDYVLDLACAGDSQEATAYAGQWLAHAQSLVANVHSSVAQTYHAHCLHSVANCYELLGDHQRSLELRREVYETYKELPQESEAYLYGILSAGQSLVVQSRYEEAIELLEAFIRNAEQHRMLKVSAAMASAYFNLTISKARTGQVESAWKSLNNPYWKNTLATIRRTDEAIAEAEILFAEGKREEALKVIDSCKAKCKIIDGTPVENRLSTAREHLGKADSMLATEIKSQVSPPSALQPSGNADPVAMIRSSQGAGAWWIFVLLVISLVTTYQWQYYVPTVCFLVLLLILGWWRDKKQLQAASAAVQLDETFSASVRIIDETTMVLKKKSDGTTQKYFYTNSNLKSAIKSIAESDTIDATIYVNNAGKAKAARILGYYTALADSFADVS